MKRLIVLFAAVAMLLTGCGGRVDLMPNASPETSALALYVYDGQTITRQFLFETEAIRDGALKPFRQAKAEPTEVDVTALRGPFYALEIGSTDEGSVCGIWADGYFITEDGSAYRLDCDFDALLSGYDWDDLDTFRSLSVMPCASQISKTEAGWNRSFLTPAADPQWPEGITLELLDQSPEALTVRFSNASEDEWDYGYAFQLQVLLEDQWYDIPSEQELSFIEVSVILPAGVSQTETYDLTLYGDLPDGTYRLVTDSGLWVTFELES